MKIKYILLLLSLVNLMTVSCQSKSKKINLSILNEHAIDVIREKQTYPLRYRDFIDSLHYRVVLQENYIQDKWQPFKDKNFKLGYMDVYFNKEKVVGFKGYIEAKSESEIEPLYKIILKNISNDDNFRQVKLLNNDSNLIINEWESKELILGIEYENGSKQFSIVSIYKNELPTFYDKIFDSEFLDLTKFRDKNSQIKFKELKVLPSEREKDFYKNTINEIKKEYNKK